MPAPTIRPAADPLDDIDRLASGVDAAMNRQDRADFPGERSDQPANDPGRVYTDATRDLSEQVLDADQAALDDDREGERLVDGDPDIADARDSLAPAELGMGADDDDPIDETERAGDDAIR